MECQREVNIQAHFICPMIDSASPGSYKSGETVADTAYYKDGVGAWAALAITDTFSEVGSTGMYEITLTAAEMNHDQIIIKMTSTNSQDNAIIVYTKVTPANVLEIAGNTSAADNLEDFVLNGYDSLTNVVAARIPYPDGYIYFDKDNGSAGSTLYTHGTIDNPVNSEANAKTLADLLGQKIKVKGQFNISVDMSNYEFAAWDAGAILNGSASIDLADSWIRNMKVSGLLKGNNFTRFDNCYVISISGGVQGIFNECMWEGVNELSTVASAETIVNEGFGIHQNPTFDFVDLNNQHQLKLHNFTAHVHIINLIHANAECFIYSNGAIDCALEGSCSGGELIASGMGSINLDGAVGTTLDLETWQQVDTTNVFGKADGGSTTSVILDSDMDKAQYVDDYFNDDYMIAIQEGTGAGQEAVITDYVQSTRVATIDRTWATAPNTTSKYTIYFRPGASATGGGTDWNANEKSQIKAILGADGSGGSPVNALVSEKAGTKGTNNIYDDTNELQTNQGNWLTATGFSTHSAADIWAVGTRTLTSFGTLIVDIWHHLLSAITTSGSIGKLLKDNVDAAISTRATPAQVKTQADQALIDYDPPTHAEMTGEHVTLAGEHVTLAGEHTALAAQNTALAAQNTNIEADTNELQTNQGNWLTATGFSTHSAADIWAVGTRTLTSFGTLIADIWDQLLTAITTSGSIGKLLKDNIDATISSRSSHTAASVWAVGTRTLTSFGTLVSDIWSAGTRTLTSFGTLVSDIWDQLLTAITTSGSIGKLIKDNLNVVLSTRASQTTVDNIESLLPHSIKKNTAIAKFKFVMLDATTGNPAAGFTVTAVKKLDAGATWLAMTGSIVDNGSGVYSIDVNAADTNGLTGVWKFTAPGAEATLITFITEAT